MIKRGLSLEEAFKALNGRLKVNESKKNVEELDFAGDVEGIIEDLRQELPVYTKGKTDAEITPIKDFYGDNDHKSGIQLNNGDFILITDTEQNGLIYKLCRNKTEMLAAINSKNVRENVSGFLTSDWENILSKVKAGKFMQVILDDFDDMYLGIINGTFYAFLHDGNIESCSANTDIKKFFSETFLESTDGYETFEEAVEIPYKEFKEALDFLKEE